MQTAVEELKKTLEGADFDAIKAAQEKVSRVASEAGGAMYAAAQAAGAGADEGGAGGAAGGASQATDSADDTVVDAEVVDEGPAADESGEATQ